MHRYAFHVLRCWVRLFLLLLMVIAILPICDGWPSSSTAAEKRDIPSERQPGVDAPQTPKTILDLQPFLQTGSIKVTSVVLNGALANP